MLIATVAATLLGLSGPETAPPSVDRVADQFLFEERVVTGGKSDFMTVRHVVLRGSQQDIGRKLAEVARDRHASSPARAADELKTLTQRRYFQRYWPTQISRMRGVAEAWDVELEETSTNISGLWFGYVKPACSVVYYPPETTAEGIGVLSRNFDFTTGTIQSRRPGPDEIPVVSSPYVIESYPDEGYASLFVCAYDLLGGAVDGVNEHGLTVALLADGEMMALGVAEPVHGARAGFNVVQVGRYLLETCATIEEAKAALLEAKLYYGSIPCHYIIADASGRSFIWENSRTLNTAHIIDGDGPQVTTNFMQQLHPDLDNLPQENQRLGNFNRYRSLCSAFESSDGRMTMDQIKAAAESVAVDNAVLAKSPYAPGRTLWHALYIPERRSLDVSFYLGEQEIEGSDRVAVRRSQYLSFQLNTDLDRQSPAKRAQR